MPGSRSSRELPGTILKSPLDPHNYKLIQLCSNGLKALLVSTLEEPLKIKKVKIDEKTCSFKEVQDFNAKYLNIHPNNQNPISDNTTTPSATASSSTQSRTTNNNNNSMQDDPDPDNDLVKAVLIIGSGMAHDPVDIPGMAHYVEHGMFLGSEKHPELEAFQTFLQNNDGEYDAGTDQETTVFQFTVNATSIENALEMFADLITNPIFDHTRLQEEIEAMESEFIMKKLNDDFRYLVILRSLATTDHPMSKLGLGSRKTLSNIKNLKERVGLWKSKHYLAGNMAFAIRGNLSIKKLEELVVKHCGSIPHCNCSAPERKHLINKFKEVQPFDPSNWNRLIYATPILDTKWIKFAWVLSPQAELSYQTKPKHFLNYLFLSKVEGSLDHYLRTKGWLITICNNCPDWKYMSTSFCSIFTLDLELTEEGLKNKDEVIKATFSYIKMLQRAKTEELRRIFDEMKQINSDAFHYVSDSNLTDPVNDFFANTTESALKDLAEMVLYEVNPTDILLSKMVTSFFDEHLIRDCLARLNPKNTNLVIMSHSLEPLCNIKEDEMYNIKYSTKKFGPNLLLTLDRISPYQNFWLPPPNKFISRSFCYNPSERMEFEEDSVVLDNDKAKIVFSNTGCKHGHLPSAIYQVRITSPKVADEIVRIGILPFVEVWIQCLSYLLDVKLAPALSSLISYNVTFETAILSISLWGPSEKLPELFEIIIKTFMQFEQEISLTIFDNMTESQIDTYDNASMEAESYAEDLKQYVLHKKHALAAEWSKFLVGTTFAKFLDFVESFKDKMFVQVNLEGCVSKSEGDKVAKIVKLMQYSPWPISQFSSELFSSNRAMRLPPGERCFRVKARNKHESSHFIINHYQLHHLDDNEVILLEEILLPAMKSSCFEELRSKEHLGYFVDLYSESYHSVYGLNVQVYPPSDNFTPDYVDERIDNFILNFYKEVLGIKQNYANRMDQDGFYLKKFGITWNNVKEFYKNYLLPCGNGFKKLSVQVVGFLDANPDSKGVHNPLKGKQLQGKVNKYSSKIGINNQNQDLPYVLDVPKKTEDENGYFITDLRSFKSCHYFYANLNKRELSMDDDDSD